MNTAWWYGGSSPHQPVHCSSPHGPPPTGPNMFRPITPAPTFSTDSSNIRVLSFTSPPCAPWAWRQAASSNTHEHGLRERKKQRTRELIADTARELFLERGFDAVTVAEIARAADVDAKTVYNYFPSKPELFYHRFLEFEQAMVDAVRERERGMSILAAFGRFVLDRQGVLGQADASNRLRAITRTIAD